MSNSPLSLSSEEKAMLLEILENTMRNVLVEESRTEAITYRKYVQEKEHLIASILEKLKS